MSHKPMFTKEELLANADAIREILNMDAPEEQEEDVMPEIVTDEPKAEKIKCKCCGFFKKPRKVLRETGICGVCTDALSESEDGTVEVIGRMGKRGRNTVSTVIDGKRYKVKRLSPKHSERVAGKYASKGKGYAKRPKDESGNVRGSVKVTRKDMES